RHTRSTRDWSSDVCSSDLGRIDADIARDQVALDRVALREVVEDRLAQIERVLDGKVEHGAKVALEEEHRGDDPVAVEQLPPRLEIGRASCRDREYTAGVAL